MPHVLVAFGVAGLVLGFRQPADCRLVPEGLLAQPRNEYRGRYQNDAYGYAVTIPQGLVGYDSGAEPPPHHGFGMPVGESPQSYIMVSGSANSLEYRDGNEAAKDFIEFTRKDGRTVTSTEVTPSRLGSLPAVRVVVNYTCGKPRSPTLRKVSLH